MGLDPERGIAARQSVTSPAEPGNLAEEDMTVDIEEQTRRICAALDGPHQIPPLTETLDGFTPALAYEVAHRVRARQARRRVGRKVGFTNRGIWDEYGVHQPIWGDISAESLLAAGTDARLDPVLEPRIEPEIVLGLGRAPEPGMDAAALAACIGWVAPGFEIVQSVYPGWSFAAADTIAQQAMHQWMVLGDRVPATAETLSGLTEVSVELYRSGQLQDGGTGLNALDGPLDVLAHLVGILDPEHVLTGGEMVSTGTLTGAFLVAPGEIWSARYAGVIDAALSVRFV